MKRKTVALLMVAIVLGVVGGRLTNRLLSRPPEIELAAADEPVKVLVAKRDLAAGLRLRKPQELFEEKTLPASRVPKKVATRFEQLADQVLAKATATGQAVSTGDLLAVEGPSPSGLPKGKRCMLITVAQLEKSVFIPNALVDVVGLAGPAAGGKEQRVIVRKVKLISVEPPARTDGVGASKEAQQVILLVTPEEAMALALADREGPLQLILSKPGK